MSMTLSNEQQRDIVPWPLKNKSSHINQIYDSHYHRTMANSLSTYFPTIGDALASGIEIEVAACSPPIYEITPTNYETIERLPSTIGRSKATGDDGITPRLLQDCGDNVIILILHIVNLRIRTKTFPDKWKHELISLIHKHGQRTLPNDYRPITLLNVCNKITEINSKIRD